MILLAAKQLVYDLKLVYFCSWFKINKIKVGEAMSGLDSMVWDIAHADRSKRKAEKQQKLTNILRENHFEVLHSSLRAISWSTSKGQIKKNTFYYYLGRQDLTV